MSGRIIAELACDRCGKALWGDDDNLHRLRQEAANLHSWQIDDGDTCSTCALEILAQSVEGWEGPIHDAIVGGGAPEPWWPL
jgi:hypothetical protein